MKIIDFFVRSSLVLCFLIASFSEIHCHSGIGIVHDSQGNIFYTDLVHVWKIEPDGSHEIAVENVHTHQLFIDEKDNLYGEHVWYEGEAIDKWGHKVWCLKQNGQLVNIIPPTEGFPINNKIKRDIYGNEYFVEKSKDESILKQLSVLGELSTFTTHQFEDVRWTCTDGNEDYILIVDKLSLKKVDCKGHVTTLVQSLKEKGKSFFGVSDNHYIMGAWSDRDMNHYVAVYGAGKVKKVNADNKVSTIHKSEKNWSPSGGTFDQIGNLWILEYSNRNKARVQKIAKDGIVTTYQNN